MRIRQRTCRTTLGATGLVLAVAGCGGTVAAASTGSSSAPTSVTTSSATSTPATTASAPATSTSTGTQTPLPVASTAPAPTSYPDYTNARFGYTVEHASSLPAQAPPNDGDGASWSEHGVTEASFGANNVNHLTPAQFLAVSERNVTVTYSHVSGDRVVVSGLIEGGFVVYYRLDIVGAGSVDSLMWTYDKASSATWNPVVARTADTFRPGDVSVEH